MLIKKFQANTNAEAIMLAMEELGKDAIIMSVKNINPRGIYKLFKKPTVEVTAAIDDSITADERKQKERERRQNNIFPLQEQEEKNEFKIDNTQQLEQKLENLQNIIEKQIQEKPVKEIEDKITDDKNLECLKLINNQMIDNEVDEVYANQIIAEIEQTLKKDSPINQILSAIYQKIVLKLGPSKSLELEDGNTRFVFFIGPTGVGKTTTIAKIASSLVMEKKKKVAFVTSDTYRIAAVEQLRTYANILDVPMFVIYDADEMKHVREELREYDVVLVDTAGRSHKNREQRDDIERLILSVPEEEREIYLVLSVTTKYRDLLKITETYSQISDYRLVFTKLDETASLGNILNIRMATGAYLSYATFGQNVPDDISRTDAQLIAKQLLGGNE